MKNIHEIADFEQMLNEAKTGANRILAEKSAKREELARIDKAMSEAVAIADFDKLGELADKKMKLEHIIKSLSNTTIKKKFDDGDVANACKAKQEQKRFMEAAAKYKKLREELCEQIIECAKLRNEALKLRAGYRKFLDDQNTRLTSITPLNFSKKDMDALHDELACRGIEFNPISAGSAESRRYSAILQALTSNEAQAL